MRGVTLAKQTLSIALLISTRTPHAGSDVVPLHIELVVLGISTRTPHAGSDLRWRGRGRTPPYFNPHSPCGE